MLKEPCIDDSAPWKQRYHGTAYTWLELAKADPDQAVIISDCETDTFQLYSWNISANRLHPLTNLEDGITDVHVIYGFIAMSSRHVYYLGDEKGCEIGHLMRVPLEGGELEDVTPDMKTYTLRGVGVSHTENLLALNPINEDGFQIWCLDLGPEGQLGTPRQLYQSEDEIWRAHPSHNGEIVACNSTERAKVRRYNVLAIDTATGKPIGELWDGLEYSVEAVAFSPVPGDMRLLAHTNRSGFMRPVIWNPRTGERTDLDLPEFSSEVLPVAWSPDAHQILFAHFDMAAPKLHLYHLDEKKLTRLKHPGGSFGQYGSVWAGFSPSKEIFAVWTDSTHPGQIIAIDPEGQAEPRTILASDGVLPGRPCRSVSFPSSDGQMIQGWLYVPEGEGPHPTILNMHGGPHFVLTENRLLRYQTWVDHGFAYLTINYRGSAMFGKAFKEQIWGKIGHWEMEDIVAAHHWLVEQGIAKPDAILLSGESYGGFLTLLGLGKHPDLWAGGMADVPVADWKMTYEGASDALKGAIALWFGGTPEEKPEHYRASSPITYAENVKAPVLILYGYYDTHTPPRPIEAYAEKMKALGKPIELEAFDAGHGTANTEVSIRLQEKTLLFAHRVLQA